MPRPPLNTSTANPPDPGSSKNPHERGPGIDAPPEPAAVASPGVWTTRRLLAWTTQYLARQQIDHPRLAAEMLLAHALEVTRLQLYMDRDRPSTKLEQAVFHRLIERAADHEPVDYLVGYAPFWSMTLRVSRDVLIPRPSTETVVEHVVRQIKRTPGLDNPVIADIGTGSGAVAIAIAKEIPRSRLIATDISVDALEVARHNAERHRVHDRIEFRVGDLLDPVQGRSFDYVVSNPPYISDEEWCQVPRCVKDYEPTIALRGGGDGLRYVGRLVEHAGGYLRRPGQLVVEIAASQRQAVLERVESAGGWSNPRVLTDHEGLPRVLVTDAR